jgi:hypothetical protein
MDRFIKFRGRTCLISMLLQIGVALVLVCGVLALIPLASLGNSQEIFPIAFVGMICLLGGGMIAAIVGWGLWARGKRAGQFDDAFGPLGLESTGYLTIGRQFSGTYKGRQINAYFNRGPSLEIYVSTPLQTRMGIGTRNALARAAGGLTKQEPLALADPDFDTLLINPLDRAWGERVMAEPAVKGPVLRLVSDEHGLGALRALVLRPDAIYISQRYFHTNTITPENVAQWVEDLFTILDAAESVEPPEVTAVVSGLEKWAQGDRSKLTWIALAIVAAIVIVPLICTAFFFVVLALTGAL